jgi:chromosome segregation ATPase
VLSTVQELAHLAQRLQSESAARQRAETELASVTQRLTAAEEAYQYLQSQLSPYRLNYSQVRQRHARLVPTFLLSLSPWS